MLFGHVVSSRRRQHEHHHVGGVEDPQIPAVPGLPLPGDEHLPTRLVGVPQRLLSRAFDQRLIQRRKQRLQTLQAVGDGPQRQIQAVQPPCFQQTVGRPLQQVFVEQDFHPQRHADLALGHDARRRRRRHDGLVLRTRTGRPITRTANHPAMRPHVDFKNLGIVTAEGDKGLTAAGTMPLLFRQIVDFFHRRQVCVAAFGRAAAAGLLTPRPARPIVGLGSDRFHHARRFRGSAEELLLEQTILGLELLILLFQPRFAFNGPLMLGTIVLRLEVIIKIPGEPTANRTRPLRRRGCRHVGRCQGNRAKGIHAAL